MIQTSILLNGFSLARAITAKTLHPAALGALVFDGNSLICLQIEGSSDEHEITHSAYVSGIDVYHSARAYMEARPLFRYSPATKWHSSPVRTLTRERGLARFQFEAAGFRSADPGAPRLGHLRVAVGEDLRVTARVLHQHQQGDEARRLMVSAG